MDSIESMESTDSVESLESMDFMDSMASKVSMESMDVMEFHGIPWVGPGMGASPDAISLYSDMPSRTRSSG